MQKPTRLQATLPNPIHIHRPLTEKLPQPGLRLLETPQEKPRKTLRFGHVQKIKNLRLIRQNIHILNPDSETKAACVLIINLLSPVITGISQPKSTGGLLIMNRKQQIFQVIFVIKQ